MDDDNWFTVGKPKKIKSGENKSVNVAANDDAENMKLIISVAIEKSKFNGSVNKENVLPKKKTQIPIKIKQPQSEQKIQKVKKKSESPPGFKSLQVGLSSLDLSEFRNLLEATKLQFNNDVINLKTAMTFFNEKLRLEHAEDKMFFDKPLDYPDSILPPALKTILKQLVQKCSNESLQYFFHNMLQSLCEELNKSRNFVGHLIMLQQIAQHYPEVCISNLASTVILRNSYQNQPSICLSLFWALGTSGICDTTIGLKIWMEIISSVINVKSYTKFAFDYLQKILAVSDQTPELQISIEEYKSLIELLLSNNDPKTKLKDMQKIKANCVEMLTLKYVKSMDVNDSTFLTLLKYCKRSPEMFVRGIVEVIKLHPEESLSIWKLNFDDYSKQNVFIFNYLDNNLREAEKLFEEKEFRSFVKHIDIQMYPSLRFIKDIPAKMTDSKKQKKQKKNGDECSSHCCRWVFGSFLLIGAIGGLIAYDTHALHGGKFDESTVGKVLKDTGALPHVENAWFVSLKFSARGYKWVEEQAPVAYGKTRTFMEPYCEFAKDLGITLMNSARKGWESTKVFVAEKTPVVVDFIDKYVPGLGQKIQDIVTNTCKGFCNLTCSGWRQSVEFFRTKILTGHLSPESIGKVFNSTTERALTYYSWFHDKVDFYAKIK